MFSGYFYFFFYNLLASVLIYLKHWSQIEWLALCPKNDKLSAYIFVEWYLLRTFYKAESAWISGNAHFFWKRCFRPRIALSLTLLSKNSSLIVSDFMILGPISFLFFVPSGTRIHWLYEGGEYLNITKIIHLDVL